MKKNLLVFITCMATALPALSQNVGIGTNTPKGKLEIEASNEGIVIPRIALTALNSAAPLTSPEISELVYNTATAGTAPNNVTPGFYYWNGSTWVRLQSGAANLTGSTSININGNSIERAALTGDVTAAANSNATTVTRIQGRDVSATAPTSNQVLKWNGTAWAPAADENTTYTAGTGLTLSGTQFINNGVVTASNGLTLASNNVKLGGSLTDATTTVSVGSNTLNFTSSNGKIAIGPGASATGTYTTALGNNAVASGTEAVAIGIANTGISKNTTAGSYSIAIGSDLTTGNGSNNSPIIAIGSGFTNNTAKSIMLGVGSTVPSVTLLGGSGAVPGNVGVGTITPQRLLHLSKDNNFGHLNTNTSLFRLQNANNTTCPGTVNIWDVRVGNCGQLGLITSSSNVNPNFNILKANDLAADAPGVVASINTTAPVNTFIIDADGDVGINKVSPDTKLDVDGNIRGTELQLSSSLVFKQNPTSWTPITVTGTKGGYAGFYFEDEGRYLMMDATTQGVYTGTAWQWYFSNGTLTAGTVPVARLSGTLPIANGGTGATTAAAARTNLGLGTMATQNANAVSITGGSVAGSIVSGDIAGNAGGIVANKSGFAVNEITGSDGVYFDLKNNVADDFDVRMIYWSGGNFEITNISNGVRLGANSSSWASISDSTKKTDFKEVTDGSKFLKNFETIKLGSWRYKTADKQDRHYGPMAQEFFALFGNDGLGFIGNDTTISTMDIDGVMMIAIKELVLEKNKQQEEIAALKKQNTLLKARDEEYQNLKAELEKLKSYIYSEAKK